ncbi:MAG: PorP/SprF family type IX secretion system membrane protein [Prevotellaceae bacterium]|jgi:type IX secretion system PorP/SprF family membrane protein|nr:PorP/SprF family type IX secretion system membrane protein [Prevotellaceae bacterium]
MSIKFSYQPRLAACLLLACCLRCGQSARAQDASFSQPYMAPLLLNPAYSGAEDFTRIGATYQYRWGRLSEPYMLYSAYADYYFDAFRSGVGICAVSDRQGGGALTQSSLGASYAYNLRIAERAYLRFGMQALLDVTSTNTSKLVFPDMLGTYGNVAADDAYISEQRSDFDIAVGSVFSYRIFYIGAALRNLMEAPGGRVAGQIVTTPRKLTLHGGCNISVPLYDRRYSYYRGSGSTLMLSPNVIYSIQGASQLVALGGYVGLSGFSGGFFYKKRFNTDAVFYAICATYSSDWFSLTYSFDFGKISDIMYQYSPDVHEISLFFRIKRRPKSSYFQNQNQHRGSGQKTLNVPYINYL